MADFDLQDARRRVYALRGRIGVGTRWKHAARGTKYRVIEVGLRERDGEPVVIYVSLSVRTVCVRPAAEFLDGRFVRLTDPH